MSELLKSQLDELMAKLPKNVYGNGIKNVDWIKSSQIKYQLNLPKEYLWFVEKYNYIVLWGEFVKTIFNPQYQDDTPDDIFNYYQINIADNDEEKDKLIFLTTEELEEFYFFNY
ncbi:hypothetical protein [Moraxella oblonga]|uniref:hypothetical protein n=1 Tax=Moraxella oblonga TaxID=200413 RepID=UPI00082C46F6|nr:hypothetical protein [Moraxella oblonga]